MKLHPRLHKLGRKLVKVPGVRAAAAELGVSVGHLHGVVMGTRVSRQLLARYEAWLAARRHSHGGKAA